MATLFCFGFGYCARRYVERFGGRFDRAFGTVRTHEAAATLAATPIGRTRVDALVFDGRDAAPQLPACLAQADAVLVSIPPAAAGDPALNFMSGASASPPRHAAIVYLSSVGVYGDHAGGWVDETTQPRPTSTRTRARLAAEDAWRAWAAQTRLPLAVLRIAGIYGPGRNALVGLVRGRPGRVVKPGQVFNRVHVDDIAASIEAAFRAGADGAFNVADDEPSPPQDVIAFAAGLLGVDPGPEIAFTDAAKTMSPMALSFYEDNRRVSNRRLKAELGVKLAFPTYRDGIRALFDAQDHVRAKT